MPRGSKDGSIFFDGERYVVRRRYTDLEGRVREKKRIAYSEREATTLMRKIDREIESGLSATPQKKTFKDLADWYELHYLKPPEHFGESELDGLRSWKKLKTWFNVLKNEFGSELLRTIDHDRIDDFRRRYQRTPTRHGKPRMVHSVNRSLELLRRMLNLAKRKPLRWIQENPFDDDEPLIHKAEEVERMVILSRLQEDLIIKACVPPRAHLLAAFLFALDTAARPNEQFRIQKQHVRLEDGLIVITRQNAKVKRLRFVPISERLRAVIEPLIENLDENDRIFTPLRMRRSFRTACRIAGVQGVRWQDLRHTGIMRMLDATKDPAKVMKITGHTNWTTFMKYVNLNPEIAREVAAAMDADQAGRLVIAEEIVREMEPIEIDSIN